MAIYLKNKKKSSKILVICIVCLVVASIFFLVPSIQLFLQTINKDNAFKKSNEAYKAAVYMSAISEITLMEMAYYDGTYLIVYDDMGTYTLTLVDEVTNTMPVGFASYIDSNTHSVIYNLGKKMTELIPLSEVEKCAFKIMT